MLHVRRALSVSLPVALWAVLTVSISAMESEGQTAVDSLLRAQQQFDSQDYSAARSSLWQAYGKREELTQPQRRLLDQRLGEVDQAIHQRLVAGAVYEMAQKAMKDQNWALAKNGFSQAARCPYLPADVRSQALRNLAQAEAKLPSQAAEPATPKSDDAELAAAVTPKRQLAVAEAVETSPAAEPPATQPKAPAPVESKPAPVETKAPASVESKPAPVETKVSAPAAEKPKPPVADVPPPKPAALPEDQARRIRIDMLVAQGRDALNRNQPEKAAGYFERALKMEPDDEAIRRQLDYARQQTAQPGEAGILTKYVQQQRIAKQIVQTDIAEAVRRARELMAQPKGKEDFEASAQAARVAKSILQNNKRLFTTQEYREQLTKIENLISWVDDKHQAWNQVQVAKTVKEISEAERRREFEERGKKDRKIAELVAQAHSLRSDRKYSDALRVMEQIVEIEPQNTWALDNIYMMRQFISLQAQRSTVDAQNTELSKLSANVREAEIPWYDKIRYPKDWKQLTASRERYGASASTESEVNRAVQAKLRKVIPKFRLEDQTFESAIDYLREISDANIYVNWGAIEVDSPDARSKPVNVKLNDVTVEKALQVILEDAGGGMVKLGYVVAEGVINISTQDKLKDLTYPLVYDIRDLLARVPNFTARRISTDTIGSSGTTGTTGTGTSGTSGSSSSTGLFEEAEGEQTTEESEDYIPTRSEMVKFLTDLISTTIDRESWYPNGSGAINELNGNLVITQTAENHRLVQELIGKLREARTIQVSIEARFITVNTGYLSQIGIDMDFYFNIGSEIGGPASTDPLLNYPPSAVAPQFVGTTTDPFTGVTIPLRNASGWNQAGHNADASMRKWSPVTVGQNSSTFSNLIGQQTNVPNGIGTTVTAPAMSIAGTFLDDLQVDFLIQATQAHSSTRTLTAPRVTLFNGQRAYVAVATQQAYIAGLEPVVGENVAIYRPIVNYAPTGTVLDVDATVSHDRRYVTMTLRPQVSTLQSLFVDPFFGIGLPNLTLQEIETTVIVPDGGTLLIGGQKLAGEVEREMGVPVISKLPVINRAFTNKGKLRDESTLLILVKPTIIIQDEAENDQRLWQERPAFEKGISQTN